MACEVFCHGEVHLAETDREPVYSSSCGYALLQTSSRSLFLFLYFAISLACEGHIIRSGETINTNSCTVLFSDHSDLGNLLISASDFRVHIQSKTSASSKSLSSITVPSLPKFPPCDGPTLALLLEAVLTTDSPSESSESSISCHVSPMTPFPVSP